VGHLDAKRIIVLSTNLTFDEYLEQPIDYKLLDSISTNFYW